MLISIMVVGALLYMSLDFKKPYPGVSNDLALHPLARFIAGMAVLALATYNPAIAMVGLLIVFFWIADVNLLASFDL